MKFNLLLIVVLGVSIWSPRLSAQSDSEVEGLGLPGDNLNLYAVLDLFQKSKTIEEFEKELNLEKTGINNLDLDLDEKVDFIKVETKQKDDDFTFILQVAVSEKETQDVAVILISKDDKGDITMQIVGDKDLYGKDYIIEPQDKSGVTANPGYKGDDPVTENVPATTTTVVVQSAPIVQYVYSPVYVPYYPPYYYGYYPPYYAAFRVMAVGVYWGHHSYYHHGGYGYGHTTVIHNHNNYYNYNNNRQASNTVSHNKANGNYGNTKPVASTRPSTGASTRPSAGASPSTRPSTSPSTRPSTGATPSTRPTTAPSTRPSTGATPSSRPSPSASPRPSNSSSSMGASRNMSSSSYGGGTSRSGYSSSSASRGGGGYSGGASRSGGGGRRR